MKVGLAASAEPSGAVEVHSDAAVDLGGLVGHTAGWRGRSGPYFLATEWQLEQ